MSTPVDDPALAALASTSAAPRLPISKARDSLPALVNLVSERPNMLIELDRREQPQAFLVSTQAGGLLKALYENRIREVLLNMAVRHWLGADAPEHITAPQLRELADLSIGQYVALLEADPDQLSADQATGLGLTQRQFQRLKKSRQIALVIAQARHDDLYELNEHHTRI